ncbi:MAG: phosphopantetheine-binding protein [Candidatus Solibacter sp.]|nr:phosphopantetheine-binding protein [Candidatus Solibacter sp.]
MQERIRGIIAKIAKREVTIGPDESLFDSGVLDSFALIDMVGLMEHEFQVKIPDSDLNPRKLSSISRIESYLETLK